MATKKQNKHIAVRKLRAALKSTDAEISHLRRGIHQTKWRSGASKQAFEKASLVDQMAEDQGE